MKNIRIGIDFGYRYTGIAVLDQDNTVLRFVVIKHNNISSTVLARRINRSARRRKHTQTVRLRNFRALLKGMGIEPKGIAEKTTQADKKFIGNQLYAMAHRRGWDYSSLVELLVNEESGGTSTVKDIDRWLIDEFGVPHDKQIKSRNGQQYATKTIKTTCLGELASYQKVINNKKSTEDARQEAESKYDKLHYHLDNAELDSIKEYISKRLKKSGVVESKVPTALGYIMVKLGLNVGKDLHGEGKLYTPHKNRHRNEFVEELKKTMDKAFANPVVKQKAEQLASSQNVAAKQIKEQWIKNAIAIMDPNNPCRGNKSRKKNNKDVRPARFQNRHTGKCPARLENGSRCNCNLPKKSREDIRSLQFEIEARQMNVKSADSLRKLTDQEIVDLISCVNFKENLLFDNGEKWKEFFVEHKTPNVKEDARGKKDILKDIATGGQSGRIGLCKTHLHEKLNLLKKAQTESKDWARLHQERQLSIYENDAPPSIRQKVERVINTIKKELAKLGYDLNHLPIEHIGIETARFDISALAQNEGKKLKKKKNYQKKSNRRIDDLKEEQGNKCLYCGGDFGFATVDHIFPKSRGGSDFALNRAAAHDICNINKGNGFVKINPIALSKVKENNLKKWHYIQRGINERWELSHDSLAGAQHTMFGAKLLKGSLITALQLEQLADDEIRRIFPKIKPREVSMLRKNWFPLMHRQKSALRYKDNKSAEVMKIVVGEDMPKPVSMKWKDLPDNISIELERPEKIKHWIKYCTAIKDGGRMTEVSIDNVKQGDEGILRYRFTAVDHKTGEIQQDRKLHIVIQPAKNDGIHDFHHAMDAVVAATKVDWAQLNLIDSKTQTSDDRYVSKLWKAIGNVRPEIDLPTISIGKSEYVAPNTTDFLIVDKRDQSGPKASKTDTQAVRVSGEKFTKRVALCSISFDAVKSIQSVRIRALMAEAFANIKSMTGEEKKEYLAGTGGKMLITQNYFLQLQKSHPLHPINTRMVRCAVTGTGKDQMFKVIDKKTKGVHHYKRTVAWEKAVVYEYMEMGKKKTGEIRFKEKFYVNKNNTQTCLPEGAKIIAEFKRGDTVMAEDKSGEWVISKLGARATLVPHDKVAMDFMASKKDISSAYKKLTKIAI